MKRKIISFVFAFATMYGVANGQSFTKHQMLEDYNQLYKTLTDGVPHFGVRKKVTGVDIPKELRRIRKDIDTVTCDQGFYDVLFRAIDVCNDIHISIEPNERVDSLAAQKTIDIFNHYYRCGYHKKSTYQKVVYIDGIYYTYPYCKGNDWYAVHIMSQLTHVNGIPVDEYVAGMNKKYSSSTRWDFKNGKAWTRDIYDPRLSVGADSFIWTIVENGETKNVNIGEMRRFQNSVFTERIFKVMYFDKDSTLYVRVPTMSWDEKDIEFVENEIAKYVDKPRNRVAIDVRENGGGTDMVWHRVLSAIIDKPLKYSLRQAVKSPKFLTDEDKNRYKYKLYGETFTGYYDDDSETTINPSERSIKYDGKIYVMVNQNIFSSTMSLLAVCDKCERLVSVGEPTGYLCGMGGTPKVDILRHSRLMYCYPYTIDITDVNPERPETIYKDKVEVVLHPSIRQASIELRYDKGITEEYLYQYDWVFQWILNDGK